MTEQRVSPRGELTPEIREAISRLRIAILAEDEGVLARLDDLVSTLSGPPSGQESRDTVLLDWLDKQGDPAFRVHWQTGRLMLTVASEVVGEGQTAREAIEDAISAEIVDEAGEGGFDTEERP